MIATSPSATPCPTATPATPARLPVLLVISSLEPGGAQRQVVQLANHLDAERFEVHVCSLSPVTPLAEGLARERVQLHLVEKHSRFDTSVVPRLAALMQAQHIAIAHAFLFDAEMATRLAGRRARVPVVVASERNSNYRRPWLHAVGQRLTRGRFDVLIANSSAGKAFTERTLGLPPERVAVVRNGVDCERFCPNGVVGARQRLGVPAGVPVVGMVAMFKRQKNHADFFAMAHRILQRFPDARFICAGEPLRDNQQGAGDYHREMLALLQRLGLTERCLLVGEWADMPALYRACDVTVLTSTREGTPNVLLESLACGVPVVATDVADNAKLIRDGEHGYIVPVGDVDALTDRVRTLLTDPPLRARMGDAGRALVASEYSNEQLAERTARVYLDVWQRKQSRQSAACAPQRSPLRVLMALPDRRVRGGPPSHLYLLRDELRAVGAQVQGFPYGARVHDEGPIRRGLGRLADLAALPLRVLRYWPDVVHLNSAFDRKGVLRDAGFVPIARLMGRRVVVKFHGSDLAFLEEARGGWRWLQRLVVCGANAVGVLSGDEQQAFLRHFPQASVVRVKNALDFARYQGTGQFRRRFDIPADKPLLLFIARFVPAKGMREVLQALPKILDSHDVHLAMVGDGPARAETVRFTRELGLTEHVTFTGYVPEDDTVDAYLESDLLVFPTYHQEGMPMVIFHSLACGLPVVTTRIRAAADWLRDGEHCVFVPDRDADRLATVVSELLADADRRARMSEQGRALVERFDKRAVAAEFLELYRSLAPGAGKRGAW